MVKRSRYILCETLPDLDLVMVKLEKPVSWKMAKKIFMATYLTPIDFGRGRSLNPKIKNLNAKVDPEKLFVIWD